MKKVFLTLAVFVMAFGNANLYAQTDNPMTVIQKVMKQQQGLRDDSWYSPETAIYTELDGGSVLTFRNTYTYDEYEYYLTEKLIEQKNGNAWNNKEFFSYQYDFAGNPLEVLSQEWENGAWENDVFVTYTYNTEDLISEIVTQEWEDGEWINEQKMVFNFTGEDFTIITYEWDDVWRTDQLYTVTYDFSGSYVIVIQYMQGGAWQNEERATYTVNELYMIKEIVEEEWVNNAWQNDERKTYNFDGELVSSIDIEEWVNGAWTIDGQVNYTNQNGNATYAIYKKWNGSQWMNANGEIEMFYSENSDFEEFDDVNEVNVQYIDLSSVNENHVKAFSICPNPTSDMISINGEGFQKAEIYNTTGQKLMETKMNSFNVSHLSSGIYMLKVYNVEGVTESQSFVVK